MLDVKFHWKTERNEKYWITHTFTRERSNICQSRIFRLLQSWNYWYSVRFSTCFQFYWVDKWVDAFSTFKKTWRNSVCTCKSLPQDSTYHLFSFNLSLNLSVSAAYTLVFMVNVSILPGKSHVWYLCLWQGYVPACLARAVSVQVEK